jgi:hypothetical protein
MRAERRCRNCRNCDLNKPETRNHSASKEGERSLPPGINAPPAYVHNHSAVFELYTLILANPLEPAPFRNSAEQAVSRVWR